MLAELQALQPEIVSRKMFGMPSLTLGGKPFAGLTGSDMIFKLPDPALARALSLPGAHRFEPMAGRKMKAWVQVPPEHAAEWPVLAEEALHNHLSA